jgi:hypothetical protein
LKTDRNFNLKAIDCNPLCFCAMADEDRAAIDLAIKAVNTEPFLYVFVVLSSDKKKQFLLDQIVTHPELMLMVNKDSDVSDKTILRMLKRKPEAVLFVQLRTKNDLFWREAAKLNVETILYMVMIGVIVDDMDDKVNRMIQHAERPKETWDETLEKRRMVLEKGLDLI